MIKFNIPLRGRGHCVSSCDVLRMTHHLRNIPAGEASPGLKDDESVKPQMMNILVKKKKKKEAGGGFNS